jgi:hypothetical protein
MGGVPHPTNPMKLMTRCGTAAVDERNEVLLATAACPSTVEGRRRSSAQPVVHAILRLCTGNPTCAG